MESWGIPDMGSSDTKTPETFNQERQTVRIKALQKASEMAEKKDLELISSHEYSKIITIC